MKVQHPWNITEVKPLLLRGKKKSFNISFYPLHISRGLG